MDIVHEDSTVAARCGTRERRREGDTPVVAPHLPEHALLAHHGNTSPIPSSASGWAS